MVLLLLATGTVETYLAVVIFLLVRLVTAVGSFAALGCDLADFFLGTVGEVARVVVVSSHGE
jgi:hypothetical protein